MKRHILDVTSRHKDEGDENKILRSMSFYCCCMRRNRLPNSSAIYGKAEIMHCSHLIKYVHEKSSYAYPNAFQQMSFAKNSIIYKPNLFLPTP
jgi:hypothetical protein